MQRLASAWMGDALTLARRVSHDMRTPLGAVTTTSELLGELLDGRDENAKELARSIESSADQALGLLKKLVGVLRASYGTPPARERADTRLLVDGVMARLERLRRTVNAEVHWDEDWPEMEVVPEWVEMVLGTLLENALRHGGRVVHVGCTREPEVMSFWVSDNGSGLSEIRAQDPFPAFETLYESHHVKGLGLSIARRYAELQGGELRYVRLPEGQSVFSLLLPIGEKPAVGLLSQGQPTRERGSWKADPFLEPLEIELSPSTQEFDTLLSLVRRLLETPVALISVQEEGNLVATVSGLEDTFSSAEAIRQFSDNCVLFCQKVIQEGAMAKVTLPAVGDLPQLDFFGVPVNGLSGKVVACLAVMDVRNSGWSKEDESALTDFAQLAQKELRLREKRRRLALAIQRVREDEVLNQSLMDNTTDCIKLLDSEGRMLSMNAPGCVIMEVDDFSQIRGVRWPEVWPRASRSLAEDAMKAALEGQTGRFQAQCPTLKGNWKWWDVVVTGVLGNNNQVEKMLSISRDITQSKQAELTALTSVQSLRNVLDSIHSFVALLTPEGTILEVNAAALSVVNTTPGEVIGRYFVEGPWWRHSGLEQRAVREDIAKAAAGQTIHRLATAWTTGGNVIEVDFTIEPIFDADGKVTHLVPSGTDLSRRFAAERALRETDERLQLLADNMMQFAWITQADGFIVWYNRRWFDYTGTTLEEMQGWGWQKVHHPDHLQRVTDKWRIALAEGVPWEDTFPLKGADGNFRWFLSRAIPIRNDKGEVVQWFGTNTDVTHQLEIEQALRKASQAKDDFIAVLSHELRTPLNPALLIASAAAERDDLPEEVRQDFDVIRRNVEMEARLIDDLLDMTRILRGKMPLIFTTVRVDLLLDETLTVLNNEATAKGITVRSELNAKGLSLQGDEVRLRQLLWNVLGNAVKFTPPDGVIQVMAQSDGSHLVISIKDSGVGISEAEIARIFDPFAQGDHAAGAGSHRFGGLGLGLAISRLLVEHHGGSITAKSDGHQCGTLMTITLPLSNETPAVCENTKDNGFCPEVADEFKPLHILLIEDHDATRDTLCLLLRRRGHSVVEADTVEAGYQAAQKGSYDLIMSDIGLPDGRGDELLARLRGEGIDTPALALTGYGMESDIQRCREAGFAQHLTKPISISDLERALVRMRSHAASAEQSG